jgi:hypothetical protein
MLAACLLFFNAPLYMFCLIMAMTEQQQRLTAATLGQRPVRYAATGLMS